MNYYPQFIELLDKYLSDAERSQSWLANKLGIRPATVNRWLNHGTRPDSPETVIRILDNLGIYDEESRRELLLSAGYGFQKREQEEIKAGSRELPNIIEIGTAQTGMLIQGGEHMFSGDLNFDLNFEQARPSPFIVGPPIVKPNQFFGREKELKRIFQRLTPPIESLAIVGPRRSGKTSLLHYIRQIATIESTQLRTSQREKLLLPSEHHKWIFVDFQDSRMQKVEGLLTHILVNLELNVPTPCNLDNFMDTITYDLETPTVILMDEIDAALNSPELDRVFWDSMRSLLNSSIVNLGFVIAVHEYQVMRDAMNKSIFFNVFNTLELGPLTETEAQELIASSPYPFSTEDTNWIIEKSKLWPVLLQIFCQERFNALKEGVLDDTWKNDGLRRIEPFQNLIEE